MWVLLALAAPVLRGLFYFTAPISKATEIRITATSVSRWLGRKKERTAKTSDKTSRMAVSVIPYPSTGFHLHPTTFGLSEGVMQNHDMSVRGINALYRRQKPLVKTSATGGTIAANRLQTQIVTNAGASGATVWALPAAKKGMRVKAIVQAAQALRLDPSGTETIALPSGVQQAAGKYVQNSTIGSYLHLVVLTDGKWDVEAFNGTWTAEA